MTLRLYCASALVAVVEGNVFLRGELGLSVLKVLDLKFGRIGQHSYSVFRGAERIRWYDSQPHRQNAALSATLPHHCHEPPDSKHNRRPALGISFTSPNLPVLLTDCIALAEPIDQG